MDSGKHDAEEDPTGDEVATATWQAQQPEVTRPAAVVTLRYFAAARDAAGTGSEDGEGATVGAVLDGATARHGERLARVVGISRVWVNGEPAHRSDRVAPGDEVAVLPPVSGGAGTEAGAGMSGPALLPPVSGGAVTERAPA